MSEKPENIEIKLEGPGQYDVRFGESSKLLTLHPKSVAISGDIKTPLEWFKKKYTEDKGFSFGFERAPIGDNECNIQVDVENGTLTLTIQEYSEYAQVVKGALTMHYAHKIFNINSGKPVTLTDLQFLIKRNAYWFSDRDKHLKLLTDLHNLKGNVNKAFTNANDNKGNTEISQKIETVIEGVELSFVLKMPIYNGTEPKEFFVEIYIHAQGSDLKYELVSPQLQMLIEEVKETEFKNAIGTMQDKFAIIYK